MADANKKMRACVEFFNELAALLSDRYEIVCPFDKTGYRSDKYLVPNGTADEITYYSKPLHSFRVSTHWNWRESLDKCDRENYIQCLCPDMLWAKKRDPETGRSEPIRAEAVAILSDDGKYHVIFGEYWNRKTKSWDWKESDPNEVFDQLVANGLI